MKTVLALQLDEGWDTSVTEWPGAQAPCQAGLAASAPRSRLFLGNVYAIQLCCCWSHRHTHTKKPKSHTHTHQKNPTPKTPRLRPLRPLVYLTQVLPSTKYRQISVLFGPEGWRELESCLCCCQCFLMMFLTRENELVCLRIQIPCGAWFGKLKICEGK